MMPRRPDSIWGFEVGDIDVDGTIIAATDEIGPFIKG